MGRWAKQKSYKEKLKELVDVVTGRKTIEQIVKDEQKTRYKSIVVDRTGSEYMIDGKTYTEQEYQQWKTDNDQYDTHIIVFSRYCSPLNEPLVEEEDMPQWIESKISSNRIDDAEPIAEPTEPQQKKRKSTIIKKDNPIEKTGQTFKMPPFKVEHDMNQYRWFTSVVSSIFNNNS